MAVPPHHGMIGGHSTWFSGRSNYPQATGTRPFGDSEHKADPSQIYPDQEHLEGHHDFVFRRAEVKKDRLAGLSKVRLTGVTAKDTSFAALGEIRGNGTHVTLLHASIMSTLGIGARLAPIFGFPHRSILR